MLQVRCPDGKRCPNYCRCCPADAHGSYFCCPFGAKATCCSDFEFCCPPRHACLISRRVCVPLTDSLALPVQAILLVNSTDKRGSDGTASMDPKDSKIIPSQQVEKPSNRIGFIGTSGDVFPPDEKYQCPDGTSVCELSSGIYGCCHLVRGYVNFWQENSCFSALEKFIYLFTYFFLFFFNPVVYC